MREGPRCPITIAYPNEGKFVRGGFGFRCEALGRNGAMFVTALEVRESENVVTLTPITSLGIAGRCQIEIPRDKTTLNAIAGQLRAIAAQAGRKKRPAAPRSNKE